MKNKIISGLLLIIFISLLFLAGYHYNRKIDFPDRGFKSVKLLSLKERIIIGKESFRRDTLLPYNTFYFGNSFIDENGNPLHSFYNAKDLNQEEQEELFNCLIAPPPLVRVIENECLPDYQDAVIFYDENNKPVSWINICFRCNRAYFYPGDYYSMAHKGFDNLRKFFIKSGMFK